MRCGLLGRKLGHSYSPQIHQCLGNDSYELFEVEPEDLEQFLCSNRFDCLNVTMPYKKEVMKYCAELSPVAQKLGAVNTIVRNKAGKLIGHNSDYSGFLSMVNKSGLSLADKKVLILGSGGASCTVQAALDFLEANWVVISRNGKNNYDTIHSHCDAHVIINTTPVGMYPDTGFSAVDLSLFPHLEGVLDLIYNPARTKLLLQAERRSVVAENGLWMLVAQAKESAQWFTGAAVSDSVIDKIYQKLSKQMQNVILIGMPGCGKSTVGQLLAERLGRTFVDTDSVIEKNAGISIPEIFAEFGESHFRDLETEALRQLGKEKGLVIATGGGCVTKERNYPLLHQNGTIYWIQRDLESLETKGRPLSAQGSLSQMYQIRKGLYQRFSDHIIDNNLSPQDCVDQILKMENNI